MALKIEMFGTRKKQDKLFRFDEMFSDNSTQDEVYGAVSDIVQSTVAGYNATVFAYGATGSGKTFTMMGTASSPGIIPRAIGDIFENIDNVKERDSDTLFHVEVSFVELYNNNFRNLLRTVPELLMKNKVKSVTQLDFTDAKSTDLTDLNRDVENAERLDGQDSTLLLFPTFLSDKIEVHESDKTGVFLAGPNLKMVVRTAEEAVKLVAIGNQYRAVAPIQCNDLSSRYESSSQLVLFVDLCKHVCFHRSHSILTFYVESRVITKHSSQQNAPERATGDDQSSTVAELRLGKLHLVDLAGSERLNESKAEGGTLVETQNINKSLLALGDVLHALSTNATALLKNQRLEYGSTSAFNSPVTSTEGTPTPRTSQSQPNTTLNTPMKPTRVHIPYLNSKLTHLLKDSLGGNTKTVMMCCVSPEMEHYHQTYYTLMYASRAKKVRNYTLVNRVEISEELMDLTSEANLIK
jgi:hypothetical protein